MSMQMVVSSKQLRAALAEIEAAESRGFGHCLAVFSLMSAGFILDENKLKFDDLICRASNTNSHLDWGRGGMEKYSRFIDGKVVDDPAEEYAKTLDTSMNKTLSHLKSLTKKKKPSADIVEAGY